MSPSQIQDALVGQLADNGWSFEHAPGDRRFLADRGDLSLWVTVTSDPTEGSLVELNMEATNADCW